MTDTKNNKIDNDIDDTCPDSLCCQTKKNMCEQHPSTTLRANCSRVHVPVLERQAPKQP
jgi:hypothetical protein